MSDRKGNAWVGRFKNRAPFGGCAFGLPVVRRSSPVWVLQGWGVSLQARFSLCGRLGWMGLLGRVSGWMYGRDDRAGYGCDNVVLWFCALSLFFNSYTAQNGALYSHTDLPARTYHHGFTLGLALVFSQRRRPSRATRVPFNGKMAWDSVHNIPAQGRVVWARSGLKSLGATWPGRGVQKAGGTQRTGHLTKGGGSLRHQEQGFTKVQRRQCLGAGVLFRCPLCGSETEKVAQCCFLAGEVWRVCWRHRVVL